MTTYLDFILYMLAAGVLVALITLTWSLLRTRHRQRLQDGNRRI